MVNSDDFVFKQFDDTEVFRVEDNGDFDIAGGAGSTGVTVTSAGQITADGRIIIDNAIDATSTTDGSLQTDGGLSVTKDAIFGNDVSLLSDDAILNFGTNSDVKLTHIPDTALLLNDAIQLQFRDSDIHISSDTDGFMNIQANTGVNMNINNNDKLLITNTTSRFNTDILIQDGGDIGSVSDPDAISISSGGEVTFTGNTVMGSVDINGGTIDGTIIGGSSTADGTFAAIIGSSLDVSDGNITNVGSIACDSVVIDTAANGLDIVFGGVTTTNKITLTDNLADALNINEGGNSYMKFITSNSSEQIVFGKNSTFNGTTIADLGTVTTADINGGTIDGTTIGGTTPAVGSFTTINATTAIMQTGAVSNNVLYLESGVVKKIALANICFLKGTKITMSDKTQMNIEDLTLEDEVLTYNIETLSKIRKKKLVCKWESDNINGKFSKSSIRNIWINPTDSYLVINNKLKITKHHLIHFKRNNRFYFNFAEFLLIDDELFTDKGFYVKVSNIQEVKEDINVYNFEIEKDQTYFAENYLVHHYCKLCSGYANII